MTGLRATNRLLHLAELRYAWPGADEPVFDGLDLRVDAGETVFLAGASGSGKSTLLALIGGLIAPDAGRIEFAGTRLDTMKRSDRDKFRAEHLGVIFQQFNLLPWLDPVGNVLLGCRFSRTRGQRAGATGAEARRLLGAMGIDPASYDRRADQLSVGQQQRVAAARALIGRPDLVLADEPTSALDNDRRDDFLDLLFQEVRAAGAALLFVSHDRGLVGRFDRVLELDRLKAGGATC